jgi:hypothetical protein
VKFNLTGQRTVGGHAEGTGITSAAPFVSGLSTARQRENRFVKDEPYVERVQTTYAPEQRWDVVVVEESDWYPARPGPQASLPKMSVSASGM